MEEALPALLGCSWSSSLWINGCQHDFTADPGKGYPDHRKNSGESALRNEGWQRTPAHRLPVVPLFMADLITAALLRSFVALLAGAVTRAPFEDLRERRASGNLLQLVEVV
jgi:hypothetical protein